jgi:hypothetical protein
MSLVSNKQEAGWASGLVWQRRRRDKNSCHAEIELRPSNPQPSYNTDWAIPAMSIWSTQPLLNKPKGSKKLNLPQKHCHVLDLRTYHKAMEVAPVRYLGDQKNRHNVQCSKRMFAHSVCSLRELSRTIPVDALIWPIRQVSTCPLRIGNFLLTLRLLLGIPVSSNMS